MMYELNTIPFKARMRELFYDYLVILGYLLLLFALAMAVYTLIFHGIPNMSEFGAQVVALFSSVVPMVLIFSYLDYAKGGSFGKKRAGLKLVFRHKSAKNSLLRNVIKFLPWQLGHMGTIHGMYTDFGALSIAFSYLGLLLAAMLLCMTFFRKDKRHLGDLLAGTQVQVQAVR